MDASSDQTANQRVIELLRAGKMREAELLCRQILTQAPADAAALHSLGVIATRAGHMQGAIDLFNQAILLKPDEAEFRLNLSLPLMSLGRRREAIQTLRAAVSLDPRLAAAFSNLGVALAQEGNAAEAEIALRRALELQPSDVGTLSNLGSVVRQAGRLDEATDLYRKATSVNPNDANAWNALGSCLRENGCIGQAIAAFRKAVSADPNARAIHSNLVYALHFDPDTTPRENFAEHLRWAAKFTEPLRARWQPHANDRSPNRRLRVGYVSPEFRNHVVGWFMEPILRHHDHAQFEIYCYSDVRAEDEVTARLRLGADVWRTTANLSDEALAQQIRTDGIDVLVDLTLHMRHNRLGMFALKPAPVQITHLAYCATSGMSAMDRFITDPHLCPARCEGLFTEKRLDLPQAYWCYTPPPEAPPVGALPAIANGYITFGSLNSFAKVNEQVIVMWAAVLAAVPDSRLIVHCVGGNANRSARERFENAGIGADRLILVGSQSRADYLATYNDIDIALDPFPYAGGTTSLDALWMGVPLITLAGKTPVNRAGMTLFENLRLGELIAESTEQYVRKAMELANDRAQLQQLRRSLRDRMCHSPLLNAAEYVCNLESAYRIAWKEAGYQ